MRARLLLPLLLGAACGGGSEGAPPQQVPAPTGFAFESAYAVAGEASGSVRVEVRRSGDGAGVAEIELRLTSLTAVASADFVSPAPPLRLRWEDGELGTLSAAIPLLDDPLAEPDESFQATLALLDPGHGVGTPSVASVTIEDDDPFPSTDPIVAISEGNLLLRFDSGDPSAILSSLPIAGTQGGETVVAIDVRPADGLLYGLGSKDRLYRIDSDTGVATAVRPAPLDVVAAALPCGFDFDPLLDRLRIVNTDDLNFRVRPSNAAVDQWNTLLRFNGGDPHEGADPQVSGIAYARRGVGPHDPQVYGIEAGLDLLVTIGTRISSPPPDTGFLYTVGALGIDTGTTVGFDIGPSGRAYASLTAPGASESLLARVDLETGAATPLGTIGGGARIVGIAILSP